MTTSYEKIITDEELYRRARRIFQGMDTSAAKFEFLERNPKP
jgi:trimethylamine:corrinoid methyltransferase-like protein